MEIDRLQDVYEDTSSDVGSFVDNRLGSGAAFNSASPDYLNRTFSGVAHCNDSDHRHSGYPDAPSAKTCAYERGDDFITITGVVTVAQNRELYYTFPRDTHVGDDIYRINPKRLVIGHIRVNNITQ